MRTIVAILVVLSLASAVSAGGAVLVINADGSQQVMVDGPGGKSVLFDVVQTIDKRGGTPGPTPPPDTSDPIATQIDGWADEVNDPTSRQALAEVYKRIGVASAGQSREKVMAALRQATDSVLTSTGGGSKWQGWRDKVSKLIDSEEAKGPIDWQKFCASVGKGLDTGTALDPALLQLIINLILQIIQLFFGGGTGV